jgi:AcrR family transcriptional regulator
MPPPTATDSKPLRADARRNRAAIVRAARKVFSDKGQDAQMDDIARRAKVGVGTVYRHFPTKEALLEELVRESFRELAELWLAELERPDPWDAFVELMWRSAELHAGDRAFSEVVAEAKMAVAEQAGVETGLNEAMMELVRRCQAEGTMRADLTLDDFHALFCGLGAVMGRDPDGRMWRRYLTLMIDGLRPAP